MATATATATANTIMNEFDQEAFDRELADFVPGKVFDAHAHLMHPKFFSIDCGGTMPGTADVDVFRKYNGMLHPDRHLGALFLTYVDVKGDVSFGNEYCAKCIKDEPNMRALMFVEPTDDPDVVRQEVKRLGMHGFKVYHNRAPMTSTWEADLPQFLPEWLVQIAHEQGLAITLHMVKRRGVADPSNIHWIRHYCQTYPDMKLILAHASRGFQPQHNLEGLPKLAGLENLYFDTGANCEPLAQQVIIRTFGHEKLMYGTDFPISHERGTNFAVGDAFVWIAGDSTIWNQPLGRIEPLLVGIEHLRAVKYACWSERLSDSQVEDIFWNNAARLFDLP